MYSGFSSIAEKHLHDYVAAAVPARAEASSWLETSTTFRGKHRDPAITVGMRKESARRESLAILSRQPLDAAAIGAKGVVTVALDPGTGEIAQLLGLRASGTGFIYSYYDMSLRAFVQYLLRNETALVLSMAVGSIWLRGL